MSDYRFQIVEHHGIPSLHVMVDYGEEIIQTHIPIDDIQTAIHRLEVAPGLIEFPPDRAHEPYPYCCAEHYPLPERTKP